MRSYKKKNKVPSNIRLQYDLAKHLHNHLHNSQLLVDTNTNHSSISHLFNKRNRRGSEI